MSLNGSCNEVATNYFDKLPDEMITRIFRFILNDLEDEESFWNLRLASVSSKPIEKPNLAIMPNKTVMKRGYERFAGPIAYQVARNFHEISADETLRNLCLTCKRFARIINGEHFTTPDTNQWPSVKIVQRTPFTRRKADCTHAQDNSSVCHFVENLASSEFMRYKRLELYAVTTIESCLLDAIEYNLKNILELNLYKCGLRPIHLYDILVALPNVRRLSMSDIYICYLGYNQTDIPVPKERAGRVLSALNLDLTMHEIGLPLLDYILDYLPAKEVRMQFRVSCRGSHEFIKKYLSRHNDTIEGFHLTFQDMDVARMPIHEGFNYLIDEGNYEYSIISPGRRSKPKTNLESVKYKKLAFFACKLTLDYCFLKAMTDNRVCLSEVVELALHRCIIWDDLLSKMLATLPNIKRLRICQRRDKLKTTYYFCRESDLGDQPATQEPAGPVASPPLFDQNHDARGVHEYILANPPAGCNQVLFKHRYSCGCKSKRKQTSAVKVLDRS